MTEHDKTVALAIDTAGPVAGVAVVGGGELLVELTWRTRNNHSAELIPAIEIALRQAAVERESITRLYVDRGPGGYAGLRVGISTALGLALGLGADILAIGRLEIDSYPHRTFPGPVCAVHQAGRGEVAWAVYEQGPTGWRELQAPAISALDELLSTAPANALFCGEVEVIAARLLAEVAGSRLAVGAASIRRAAVLAELGAVRFTEGQRDDPFAIEPLYLREPSITAPRPRPSSQYRQDGQDRQATQASGSR